MEKKCRKCGLIKESLEFYSHKKTIDGLGSWCKTCSLAGTKEWKEQNKELCKRRSRLYSAEFAKRIARNYERWVASNTQRRQELNRQWKSRNKSIVNHISGRRRADKMNRTPKWADLEAIKQFYIDCPKGMVVDHIIPLRGEVVSGFHVVENLQYLTLKENSKKGNKFRSYCEFYMEGK